MYTEMQVFVKNFLHMGLKYFWLYNIVSKTQTTEWKHADSRIKKKFRAQPSVYDAMCFLGHQKNHD